MKRVACFLYFSFFSVYVMAIGELRIWTAADGSSSLKAAMENVNGGEVVLRKNDGRKVSVPIDKLCEADQKYIQEHNKESAQDETSASVEKPNLPHEQGKVVGPIEASSDSHYFLYIPNSLKSGQEVPLLFFTHSMGGSSRLLDQIKKGAELTGWIMAISVESKNGEDIEDNKSSSKRAVKHLIKTLPIDDDRLYFTGNSGGAAMAFYNYDNLDGYGLMPNIGYNPGVPVPDGDCFFINGAYDYNRYTSAVARKKVGKTAIQRYFNGGHNDAPGWIMVEGMVWLEGRYLAKKGKREPLVQLEYENSVIQWITELTKDEPWKAYYWAQFLEEELKLSTQNASKVRELARTLGVVRRNKLYVEALEELDEFSVNELSSFGSGALFEHSDPHLVSECEDMLEKYVSVPPIKEILTAFCNKKTSPK